MVGCLWERRAHCRQAARRRRRSAGLRPRHSLAAPERLSRHPTSATSAALCSSPTTGSLTLRTSQLSWYASTRLFIKDTQWTPLRLFISESQSPAPNLSCDCLLQLSVRVLCFIDNITCTISRAQRLWLDSVVDIVLWSCWIGSNLVFLKI